MSNLLQKLIGSTSKEEEKSQLIRIFITPAVVEQEKEL
jgi:hypothetical protein